MKFPAIFAVLFSLIAVPERSEGGTNRPVDVVAKLIHLRGKRYQVRVVTTLPTGGFSKRAATARRFFCADDCQPSVRVTAPIRAPAPGAIVTQALTEIRHRKNIRLPRYWKVVVAVKVDGKITRRIRLTEKDA